MNSFFILLKELLKLPCLPAYILRLYLQSYIRIYVMTLI